MKRVSDFVRHLEARGGSLPKTISNTPVPGYTCRAGAFKAKSDSLWSTPGNRKECRSPLKVLCAGVLTHF